MNSMIAPFIDEMDKFENIVSKISKVKVGTLGPEGTSSHFALDYLLGNEVFKNKNVEIKLWDDFEIVNTNLLNGEIDLMLVPNAYENITKMYWNIDLKNVLSFVLQTPGYGLAISNDVDSCKSNIKIGVCNPVKCLVDGYCKQLGIEEYDVISAKSTMDAARMCSESLVDYAVTNATSVSRMNLKFITDCFSAEVVWTLFMRRSFYEEYK